MADETKRRQWLHEAHKIFQGDQTIQPKRQHVVAAMSALVEFQMNTDKLRQLMKRVYQEAAEARKLKGLPVPPPPPGLEPDEHRDQAPGLGGEPRGSVMAGSEDSPTPVL